MKGKMNSFSVNLHSYYNKLINLHNYTLTDISHFYMKLCKFCTFFYYIPTLMSLVLLHNFR